MFKLSLCALAVAVVVFFVDMLTRHFYLMFSDALSIAAIGVVIWSVRKLNRLK
ncbi:hypothetical protein [Leclercia sp. Marseille-Q4284]|uniref:hypothetical protein n=1 Tax=Leclercia sp. Marseille-Q4284 TaxID=2866582 RepID=UPI001CE45884|nr:hypothetical protein [Leclercia sp. Marseille-Q4284]